MDTVNRVIGTSWVSEVLYHRTSTLASELGFEPITKHLAKEIVYLTVLELLAIRSAWLPRRGINWEVIYSKFDGHWLMSNDNILDNENQELTRIRDIFLCDILNPMSDEIERTLLSPVLPDRSWDIYTVGVLDSGDVLIRNDGDYRIWDWERRVRAGKLRV